MKTILTLMMLSASFPMNAVMAQQAATVIDSNMINVKIEPVDTLQDMGIPFLTWTKESYQVENQKKENYVELTGSFLKKTVSASINGKTLKVDKNGNFKHVLKYSGSAKAFIVSAMDEDKKNWRMNYRLVSQAENKMTLKVGELEDQQIAISRWRYSLGTGYTLISYRDFTDIVLEQNTITIKGGVTYRMIESVLDLGLSGFYNVVALKSTSLGSVASGEKIRYLGVNARATYHLIEAPSSFRVNISGGLYWNSSSGNIGFSNMFGPQIYPDITYVFANGNSLYLYAKYAASASNSKGLSFKTNREVATGLHYSFPVSTLNRMTIGVDVSQLSLDLGSSWASTNTYSLSTGISF